MNKFLAIGAAAAAVVVAAFLGIRFLLPGGADVGDTPDPAATPTPSPVPLSAIAEGDVSEAGRYRLRSSFPVGVTFDLPAGWMECYGGAHEQGPCSATGTAAGPVIGVAFLIVENVVTDPCDDTSLADPPVGPSVDDLVTAISSLPGFEATPAEDVTLDGFEGRRFSLTSPRTSGCGLNTWATSSRMNGVGLNETNLIYVIDVDGVRVMIATASFPQTPDEQLAAAQSVIDSIEFGP